MRSKPLQSNFACTSRSSRTVWRTLPTPCSEWDVHYLVAHVVGGNRFAVSILGGMTASEAMEQVMAAPQLGTDAMAAWTTTSRAQLCAFRESSPMAQIHHPLGEMSTREFLGFRVFDVTMHAWDLARSIGADEHLDPRLVDAVIAIVEAGPPGMGFGLKVLGLTAVDAFPQARLLDLTGRGP